MYNTRPRQPATHTHTQTKYENQLQSERNRWVTLSSLGRFVWRVRPVPSFTLPTSVTAFEVANRFKMCIVPAPSPFRLSSALQKYVFRSYYWSHAVDATQLPLERRRYSGGVIGHLPSLDLTPLTASFEPPFSPNRSSFRILNEKSQKSKTLTALSRAN